MQPSDTGNRVRWGRRAGAAAACSVVVAAASFAGAPGAYAIDPPNVPSNVGPPADGAPGPALPMRQQSYCTELGVLPGTDFRVQPRYMDMLNLSEAWQFGRGAGVKVAVIDTGVSPHPRFPHLIPGGDYVMAGGDGLSDCDAHGTIVASMIGAAPATGADNPAAPAPRKPLPIPTNEPPPPPQTITLSQPPPPPPQTVIINPPPPVQTPAEEPGGQPGQPAIPPGSAASPGGASAGGAGGGAGGGAAGGAGGGGGGGAPGAVSRGHGTIVAPSYSGRGHVSTVDHSFPDAPLPLEPPQAGPSDAFSGVAPDVDLISIRQFSNAFTLKDAFNGEEDPQTRQKSDSIHTLARAIVHAANMGAQVITVGNIICMSSRNVLGQDDLGAAVRYAADDKNAVIVAAAGDVSQKDCKQNPLFNAMHPDDPRDWSDASTVVTPGWFDQYVLTVGAVDSRGTPMPSSVAGPWVSIAAPGTDVVGFSTKDNGLVNAVDGPDNTLVPPLGTSFATAIVSGVAALVRAKYPELSAHQIINRLEHTAHAPARGADNQIGYGVIDPVAALTWDVPEGPALPNKQAPLPMPPAPAPRNMTPVWVAAGGLAGVLILVGAVFGGAVLMRRRQE